MTMSSYNIEFGKRRKERERVAKEFEIVENEAAIVEMNRKIAFLKSSNVHTCHGKTSTSNIIFASSSKVDATNSDSNVNDDAANTNCNTINNVRIGSQRGPIQLERYR